MPAVCRELLLSALKTYPTGSVHRDTVYRMGEFHVLSSIDATRGFDQMSTLRVDHLPSADPRKIYAYPDFDKAR